MARPIVWFLAGVLASVLVVTGVVAGATYFAGDTEAQGTWQVKVWDGDFGPGMVHINATGAAADPESYFDDFVKTLPDNCELGPIYENEFDLALPYRCPS